MTGPADGLRELLALRAAAPESDHRHGCEFSAAAANWLATEGEAALTAMELGAAWAEAEAALPKGWELDFFRQGGEGPLMYSAQAGHPYKFAEVFAGGGPNAALPTPAAALRALAAALKGDTDAGQ
jgi:hypothetical protein